MRAIGIDTTRSFIVLVLVDGAKTIKKVLEESNKRHTSALLPAVDSLLTENKLEVADLDYISAVIGPGSFTGIRVGVATANALAYALEKPMIEVTSLQLIAYNKTTGTALIDALHNNCYGGVIEGGKITEMKFYEADELPDGEKYYQDASDDYAEAYAAIIRDSAKAGEIKDTLMPLYLRASQAEREAACV